MKCPKCGTTYKSSQQVWQERMHAQGRCIQCGKPKTEKDEAHRKCFRCRRKDSARDERRRARARQRGAIAS